MRSTVLPKLRADAAASADPMAGQVVSDFESNVDRFEKKVHDLKIISIMWRCCSLRASHLVTQPLTAFSG
ncbi:MAG: toxic anion resistance protein, partial [Alistipes sp.]|nr:toxic anion resistance protein [Alistipes sp.]